MPDELLQIDFAVPWTSSTWAHRMEAACRILEEAFPGGELRVSTPERGAAAPVPDRAAFFKRRLRTRKRWFSLRSPDPRHGLTIGGAMGGGFAGLYCLSVFFPERSWDAHERLLVTLGDATGAHNACLSPRETGQRLRRMQIPGWGPLSPPPPTSSLPSIAYTRYGGLAAAEQPGFAGWLNYWSDAAARLLGFPDAARDAGLLAHSYRTPLGAWLVKLGPEPLDCAIPRHMELLRTTYERFPKLGVRAPRRS